MDIAFDAAKDEINRLKQGISLRAAVDIDWSSAVVTRDECYNYGEARHIAVGSIDGRLQCPRVHDAWPDAAGHLASKGERSGKQTL